MTTWKPASTCGAGQRSPPRAETPLKEALCETAEATEEKTHRNDEREGIAGGLLVADEMLCPLDVGIAAEQTAKH